MKVKELILYKLNNSAHYLFLSEFSNLISRCNPDPPKFEELLARFRELLQLEKMCLDTIKEDGYTGQFAEAIRLRGNAFNRLLDVVNIACEHLNKEISVAGNRLKIVLNASRNQEYSTAHNETSNIKKLVEDLEGKFSPAIQKIGAYDNVAELKANNMACVMYSELIRRSDSDSYIAEIRTNIDSVYTDIIVAIESLAECGNKEKKAKTIVLYLNFLVECYVKKQ